MSYIKFTKTLVSNGTRGRDGNLTIKAGEELPSLEELQKTLPGSRIEHGFQVIDSRGRILASKTGFSSEPMARKGARELRRALLPGVRMDVKELAQVWRDAYYMGASDADTARDVDDPRYPHACRVNPYEQEIEEADRERN